LQGDGYRSRSETLAGKHVRRQIVSYEDLDVLRVQGTHMHQEDLFKGLLVGRKSMV
jgi:hypothetical protein